MHHHGPIAKRYFKECLNCGKMFEKYLYESKPTFDKKKFCSARCFALNAHKTGKLGNTGRTRFKGGSTPWNKDTIGVMKSWNKGRKTGLIPWNKGKKWPEMAKENNPAWKGGISGEDYLERRKFQKTVQKQVFKRDDYTCQICGSKGDLQVDHIQSWSDYIDLRFSLNNCRTLCKSCHYQITFGKPIPNKKMAWGHNLSKGGGFS